MQDKTLLLDNPAAPVKKQKVGRHSSKVTVLSGVQLKKLGLHILPRKDCRCDLSHSCEWLTMRFLNNVPGSLVDKGIWMQADKLHVASGMTIRGPRISDGRFMPERR